MQPEAALIEIQNATIWRGTSCVFENLNLVIAQHERVAILGPNGSGKTTLLKTLNRELYPVVRPDSRVRILGRDNWNVWELRKHIGVVSHDLHQSRRDRRLLSCVSGIRMQKRDLIQCFNAPTGIICRLC